MRGAGSRERRTKVRVLWLSRIEALSTVLEGGDEAVVVALAVAEARAALPERHARHEHQVETRLERCNHTLEQAPPATRHTIHTSIIIRGLWNAKLWMNGEAVELCRA